MQMLFQIYRMVKMCAMPQNEHVHMKRHRQLYYVLGYHYHIC